MRRRKLLLAAAACLLCTGVVLALQRPAPPVGLFSWSSAALTDGAFPEVVRSLHVTQVYQAVSDWQNSALPDFIQRTQAAGAQVYLCAGAPEWGLDPAGARMCGQVRLAAQYNEGRPQNQRLAGVLLDVEPYLTDAWDEDEAAVLASWADGLAQAHAEARRVGLTLIACIPNWLDRKDPALPGRIAAEGCDALAVMNYTRSRLVDALAEEAAAAKRYGRQLINISELTPAGEHDLTDDQTYDGAGPEALAADWAALRKAYPGIGTAYHHYPYARVWAGM